MTSKDPPPSARSEFLNINVKTTDSLKKGAFAPFFSNIELSFLNSLLVKYAFRDLFGVAEHEGKFLPQFGRVTKEILIL